MAEIGAGRTVALQKKYIVERYKEGNSIIAVQLSAKYKPQSITSSSPATSPASHFHSSNALKRIS